LLMFSGLAFFICLSLVETILGLVQTSERPPNHPPKVTWGHEVHTNALGFRDQEFESPKPPETYRVMVLGDSFTWGQGLAVKDRYSNLLQELLQQKMPEKRVEVLNFGICGNPTTIERDICSQHIATIDPDRIVIGFCINDPKPGPNTVTTKEDYDWALRKIDVVSHLGFPRIALMIRQTAENAFQNAGYAPQWVQSLDRTYDEQSSEWRDFVKALQDIKALADSQDLPQPIFAPLLHGDGDFQRPNSVLSHFLKWCDQAATAAEEEGFVVVPGIEAEFRSQGYQRRRVNPWDGHPNAACNKVYAEAIAAAF